MTDDAETVSVLAVDDDEDVADTYALWLDDEYDVETAYGGVEALERLDPAVDVVLLDRRMPEPNGDEVLTAVRERPGTYQVAMVTAVEPDTEVVELPFDEYLTKPVTRSGLVETVERLVVRQSLEAGLRRQGRLLATHDALSGRPGDAVEGALDDIEADMAANREAVHDRLDDLDDRYVTWSLVDPE